jgi:hypothetical protein
MTKCQCCSTPVWVMYSPAICDACERAECDPLGVGSVHKEYDSDLGSFTVVERTAPCKRWSES